MDLLALIRDMSLYEKLSLGLSAVTLTILFWYTLVTRGLWKEALLQTRFGRRTYEANTRPMLQIVPTIEPPDCFVVRFINHGKKPAIISGYVVEMMPAEKDKRGASLKHDSNADTNPPVGRPAVFPGDHFDLTYPDWGEKRLVGALRGAYGHYKISVTYSRPGGRRRYTSELTGELHVSDDGASVMRYWSHKLSP
jgi:hypothetical protein